MSDITTLMMAASGRRGDYQVSRSLRFNSVDSAYLSRTFGTPTSATIWTFSVWVKRSALGSTQQLFGASTTTSFGFNSSDQLALTLNGISAATSTAVFRDPSAWYHIVYQQNGSAQTIYVNNASVATGTTAAAVFNTAISHQIGAANTANYFSGYLADINFVDGKALVPSNFGKTDAVTGAWTPKAYNGTHGTNGFHLDFFDNTSTTTLGYDEAGSNDWTLNNFSVTAGAGNDSLVDTPTPYGTDTGVGGEVRGNYCTLNPLDNNATLSNGNLQVVTSSSTTSITKSTFAIPQSGKWYFEIEAVSGANIGYVYVGGGAANEAPGVLYRGADGNKRIDGTFSSYGSAWSNGDIIGVAVNVDDGEINFYRNGVDQGTISYTFVGKTMFPAISDSNVAGTFTTIANFGQRPFAYTAPAGYKVLCTQNIDEGTITTSGTFTGNGSADGPFVYLNGVPTAMTIDGNAVTFGTHADKLANGFKVRSSSASYNANATSMSYTISTTGAKFKYANAQTNP